VHLARDHFLPPDPQAFLAAEPATGRVIVIAPTRAACETIERAMGLSLDTLLEREHGEDIRRVAASGRGFGVVAGTGTGKTLAIRPIAETIVRAPLRVGVVNREREATPETPTWNVVIVTTGIARRWFEDGLITARDTLIVDEIHQTSAEMELCLALGKRAGCRFIWLSATVDPTFYARYLDSAEVLETRAFDPARAAAVRVLPEQPLEFLNERFIRRAIRERRGVAVFVPTRAEVEQIAGELGDRWQALATAFYHGGEPIRVIRPFLDGEVRRPFLLAMTAAGQSALNIRGLDTVVIYDARYANVVARGRNVLTRLYLGANEILQMAGRVHGRVEGGEVYILSDRDLAFDELRPTPPEFQLAGDAERVAITCAALGADARELDLPVPLDRRAYGEALELLTARGLIEKGRLTRYGREVEAMPVERPWGELLVHADGDLVPVVAVAANIESLHRMTREERDLRGLIVSGSDHLTAYNVHAEAVNKHGYLGEVYGLPRHLFDEGIDEWAEGRGVLVKAIEDVALGTASVYRQLELPLPERLAHAGHQTLAAFADLVARIMPFDLVIDEGTADGREARVSRGSVCGSWGAVAGTLRYFADRFGTPRAAIEGTQLPERLVRRYARRGAASRALCGSARWSTSGSCWSARPSRCPSRFPPSSPRRRAPRCATRCSPARPRIPTRRACAARSSGSVSTGGARAGRSPPPRRSAWPPPWTPSSPVSARGKTSSIRASTSTSTPRSRPTCAPRSRRSPPPCICMETACRSSTRWTRAGGWPGCASRKGRPVGCRLVTSLRSIGRCVSQWCVASGRPCEPTAWRSSAVSSRGCRGKSGPACSGRAAAFGVAEHTRRRVTFPVRGGLLPDDAE